MFVNIGVRVSETSHRIENTNKLNRPGILIFLKLCIHVVPGNLLIARLVFAFRDERSFAHLPLKVLLGLSKVMFTRVLLIGGKERREKPHVFGLYDAKVRDHAGNRSSCKRASAEAETVYFISRRVVVDHKVVGFEHVDH